MMRGAKRTRTHHTRCIISQEQRERQRYPVGTISLILEERRSDKSALPLSYIYTICNSKSFGLNADDDPHSTAAYFDIYIYPDTQRERRRHNGADTMREEISGDMQIAPRPRSDHLLQKVGRRRGGLCVCVLWRWAHKSIESIHRERVARQGGRKKGSKTNTCSMGHLHTSWFHLHTKKICIIRAFARATHRRARVSES